MTRDIFDSPFGTLDVIVYMVLRNHGYSPLALTDFPGHDYTPDETAESNARLFMTHFGDRKIQAIKAVREVSGFGLRLAKEAVEQVYETYGGEDYIVTRALAAISVRDYATAAKLLDSI
jgi:hypothetical protein